MENLFEKIVIIGCGIIGSSLALVIKDKKIAGHIVAIDKYQENTEFLIENGIIDSIASLEDDFSKVDLVIIASKLSDYKDILVKIGDKLPLNCLISDIGSTKSFIERDILPILPEKLAMNFIGCHPIAGSDKIGAKNLIKDLFLGKKLIITPYLVSSDKAVEKITEMWQKIGAKIDKMSPIHHDQIFALTSHLIQLIAFKLDFYQGDENVARHLRLKNSQMKMWNEIFAFNADNINNYKRQFLQKIDWFIEKLKSNQFDEVFCLNKQDVQGDFDYLNILTSIIIVKSLNKIDDMVKFSNFFGSGIKDFMAILNLEPILTEKIVSDNCDDLIKKLKELSGKIV